MSTTSSNNSSLVSLSSSTTVTIPNSTTTTTTTTNTTTNTTIQNNQSSSSSSNNNINFYSPINHPTTTTTTINRSTTTTPPTNNNNTVANNNINTNSNTFDVIGFSEEELKSIDQTFSIGAMNAFGMKQTELEILNLIDQISTLQVRSFLGSMEIELKNDESNSNGINGTSTNGGSSGSGGGKESFQSVSQIFSEKEKSISNLVKDLKIITRSINEINQKIHQ